MRISDWSSAVCSSDLAPGDGHKNDPPDEVRRVLKSNKRRGANQAIALTLLVRREYLRATVFLCSTPLATPRAISGWAACSAAAAAALSPAATADSTFRSEEHTSELQSLIHSSYAGLRLQQNNK